MRAEAPRRNRGSRCDTRAAHGESRRVPVVRGEQEADGDHDDEDDEERSLEETPSQLSVDVKRVTTSTASATEREQLLYVNCNRLVYQRYPYSTIPKNFKVQVVNPAGGGESSLVSVSAP